MSIILRKKVLGLTLIVVATSLFSALTLLRGTFQTFENYTWDWRLRMLAHRTAPDPRISIITIDQNSLDYFATHESIFWKWPRELYVPVLKFLSLAEARGVAFDLTFSEPSPYGVGDDLAFASAIAEGVPVISAVVARSSNGSASELEFLKSQKMVTPEVLEQLTPPGVTPHNFSGMIGPIPEILETSAGLGTVNGAPDEDNTFRHTTPLYYVNSTPLLSLPFALAKVARVPTTGLQDFFDTQGRLTLRFSGPERTYKTYSFVDIVRSFQRINAGQQPLINPEDLRGNLVLIGADAPGLMDLRSTPMSAKFPGMEFHATTLDNFLNASFIRKLSNLAAVGISAFVCLLCGASIIFFSRLRLQVGGVVLAVATLLSFSHWFAISGMWMPFMVPFFAMGLTLVAAFAFQYDLEGREHRFIKSAFRHYVSPELVEQMASRPEALSLGGERRELTIFFSDIVGFTSIAEKLEATELVTLLNEFLTMTTDIILKHGGTVDKYVGDAVVAFWNAPLSVPNHAELAVRATLNCQQALVDRADYFKKRYGASLHMRVGIHSGMVSVGNFGSEKRFNYTVIGDGVNLASRLEGANKHLGSSVLVSGNTWSATRELFTYRKLGELAVVGRQETVAVYEPLLLDAPPETQANWVRFEKARLLFEQGNVSEAREIFASLASDKVAAMYVRRIDAEQGSSDLTAVWKLLEK